MDFDDFDYGFNDIFDRRRKTRHVSTRYKKSGIEKALDNPGKALLKFGGLALAGYLIFCLVIIAAIVVGALIIF